jgi:hypothetical protein
MSLGIALPTLFSAVSTRQTLEFSRFKAAQTVAQLPRRKIDGQRQTSGQPDDIGNLRHAARSHARNRVKVLRKYFCL